MTTTSPVVTSPLERPTAKAAGWTRSPVAIAVTAVVVVLTFLAGVSSGRHRAESGEWHTGQAHVGIRVVSISYAGWTYGVSESVPLWLDARGSAHDNGWPDCLRPVGETLEVRFQARTVTVDGTTWRPIVAIDCRAGAAPVAAPQS